MNLLFISTLNFATNPRLVKEVRLALQQGYHVEVVCFEFDNWSFPFNQQIKNEFNENGVTLHIISGGRKPFLPWAVSVFLELFFRVIGRVIPIKGWMLSQAVTRRTMLLLRKVNRINGNFDLVIGHNPGALYPTWAASKKFNCKCGFDVEDYHPGETNDRISSARIRKLMMRYLPEMNYLTFASEPIWNEVRNDMHRSIDGKIIMNWFSFKEFREPLEQSGKLKLVWFSQNISFNRGLEMVIPVIENLDDVELHLFGNCNSDFQTKYLLNRKNIFLHPALSQNDLHKKLMEFDCGLAIEPKKDLNNDLAVSNKILAYFQAGLFIVASDTIGQKYFLHQHPEIGKVVDLNSELKEKIEEIIASKEHLRKEASKKYQVADMYCWEREGEKLAEVWKSFDVKPELFVYQSTSK